jgi:hypothetical protein
VGAVERHARTGLKGKQPKITELTRETRSELDSPGQGCPSKNHPSFSDSTPSCEQYAVDLKSRSDLSPGKTGQHLVRGQTTAHICAHEQATFSTHEIIKLPISQKERRRAEDKFGVPVMKFGYTLLPNLLLQAQGRLGITPVQLNVLVQLIQHWWDADNDPFLAKETIARGAWVKVPA